LFLIVRHCLVGDWGIKIPWEAIKPACVCVSALRKIEKGRAVLCGPNVAVRVVLSVLGFATGMTRVVWGTGKGRRWVRGGLVYVVMLYTTTKTTHPTFRPFSFPTSQMLCQTEDAK
jgi:hypothetical protein